MFLGGCPDVVRAREVDNAQKVAAFCERECSFFPSNQCALLHLVSALQEKWRQKHRVRPKGADAHNKEDLSLVSAHAVSDVARRV